MAAKKYGLEIPLADLFLMGTDRFDTKSITEAIYVGPQVIGGVLCDQLAFRQPGVDWQICIERGKAPLPRKLVVTGTDGDPAQPVRRSILTWKAGSAPEARPAPRLSATTRRTACRKPRSSREPSACPQICSAAVAKPSRK